MIYLRKVFQRCRDKRICLNSFKSVFFVWKGQLLGHIVSKDGIEMAQEKVQAVLKASVPNSAIEVSSFLGYTNFYKRFVDKYVEIAIPLYEPTQKDRKYEWSHPNVRKL